jgi:hypothetical protein
MPDPTPASVTPRPRGGLSRALPAFPPRWGFFKGFLTGLIIEVPAIAAAVWVCAQLGIGNPDVPFMTILRLTALFAGIAAVFTAAGIGRLAAYASVEKGGGRRRAAWVAARAHAAASGALVVIAAIPHGHLPEVRWHWVALPAAGLVVGALCGAFIGIVCGGAAPVIHEVAALAKRPTEMLRALLDPEDFVKLGVAVRDRTTRMTQKVFDGMFEPGPKAPDDPDESQSPSKSQSKTTTKTSTSTLTATLTATATPTTEKPKP